MSLPDTEVDVELQWLPSQSEDGDCWAELDVEVRDGTGSAERSAAGAAASA